MKIGALKIRKATLGEVKAVYRRKREHTSIKIKDSKDVNECIRAIFPVDLALREAFICLYLSRSNQTLGYAVISIGGISATLCDPKVVFQHALLCNASAIILIHNHPSGNLNPSETDLKLTQKLKEIGRFMELEIVDHLIISPEKMNYYSFADSGIL